MNEEPLEGGTGDENQREAGVAGDGFQETRASMERAIRRLVALEYAILIAAAFMAVAGGAIVALLLNPMGVPFRLSWAVISLLLFLIPAVGVARREAGRRDNGRDDVDPERRRDEADGGR